jgi:hypothetical protein
MGAYFSTLPSADFAKTSATDSIWTHGYGLKYVAYEGGPGTGGGVAGVAAVYNNDPRMKDCMVLAQDIWDQAGGDELVYYIYMWTCALEFYQ